MATHILIDEPSIFATVERWQEHMASVASLPSDTAHLKDIQDEATEGWDQIQRREAYIKGGMKFYKAISKVLAEDAAREDEAA